VLHSFLQVSAPRQCACIDASLRALPALQAHSFDAAKSKAAELWQGLASYQIPVIQQLPSAVEDPQDEELLPQAPPPDKVAALSEEPAPMDAEQPPSAEREASGEELTLGALVVAPTAAGAAQVRWW